MLNLKKLSDELDEVLSRETTESLNEYLNRMSNKTNPQEGAFACASHGQHQSGLTKREYFAAMVMQGLLSNPAQIDTTDFLWIAKTSKGYADALINALNQE